MRRLLACLLTTLGAVSLLAAGAANLLQVVPVTVVYPFIGTSSGLDKEAASRLGVIIATGMANSAGIVVKPAPPGTERKDYLTVARSLGADYYVTGYLTPVGNQVSLVEQVVTTTSGVVIFSNTAQLTTFADAAGQGEALATAIVHYANRNIGALQAPPEQATTPTPGPTSGSEANLSGLLHRKRQSQAAASPKPAVAPVAVAVETTPAPTATPLATVTLAPAAARSSAVGLIAVGGSADAPARTTATSALGAAFALAKRPATSLPLQPTDISSGGVAACNAATVGRIIGGNLTSGQNVVLGIRQKTASFELVVTDCTGTVNYRQTTLRGAPDITTATQRAVTAAVSAYIVKNH